MKIFQPPLVFSPITGIRLNVLHPHDADSYRKSMKEVWRFNPWSGGVRDPSNISGDPLGYGIYVPKDAPVGHAVEDEMLLRETLAEERQGDIANTPPAPANEIQHGGDHYKSKAIQPWDYIASNSLGYFEGNIVKYVSRWRQKGGVTDLQKAQHYLQKLIELEDKAHG